MATMEKMDMKNEGLQDKVLLMARLFITPLYIYSGIGKALAFGVTASRLPGGEGGLGTLLAAGAVAVELGGSAALILGLWTRWASLIMIAFTIAATLMFHQFWAVPAAQVQGQVFNFTKNLGLIALLAQIAVFGAGSYSLEARSKRS